MPPAWERDVGRRGVHRVEREMRKVGGESHQNTICTCKKLPKNKFNNIKIKANFKYR